jgi:hypothetical protein
MTSTSSQSATSTLLIHTCEGIGAKRRIRHSLSCPSHASESSSIALITLSDIDILSFYLSGLRPTKVHSFGSLHLFKPSKKPAAAGTAKRCLECPIEPDCAWSAKKIYIEPLSGIEDKERVSYLA